MNIEEKIQRCADAEYIQESETLVRCKVYARWVSDCADCSFSSVTRQSLGRD